jgi:hypothetical protein
MRWYAPCIVKREKNFVTIAPHTERGVSMKCPRCGGFMLVGSLYDQKQEGASGGKFGARCINCGNVEDAVICRNRVTPPSLRNAPRGGTVEQGSIFIW